MRRWTALFLSIWWLVAAGCATTSPLATAKKDRANLAGLWEEEWPGATTKDKYRIRVEGETVSVEPVPPTAEQKVGHVIFQQKRLTFWLELDGSRVYYDLVLLNETVMAGRVTGGKQNFDEPIRWYRIAE